MTTLRAGSALAAVVFAAACSTMSSSPITAPVDPAQHTTPTPSRDSTTVTVVPVTLAGELVDGGQWITGLGDAVTTGTPFDVAAHYVFVERNAAGDSVGVDRVDSIISAVFTYAGPNGEAPVPALPQPVVAGTNPDDCPVTPGSTVLDCPSSNDTTTGNIHFGQYLVSVTAAQAAGVTNPTVIGQFYLDVYTPSPTSSRVRLAKRGRH